MRDFCGTHLRAIRAAFLLLTVLCLVMTAIAQTGSNVNNNTTAKPAAQQSAPAASAGQKVYIDPVTRKIIENPSLEQIQELEKAGGPKPSLPMAPKPIFGINGAPGLILPPDTMAYSVATKASDGKVKVGCVEGKEKSEQVVKSGNLNSTNKEARDEK